MPDLKSRLSKHFKTKISVNKNTSLTIHPMKGSAEVSYQLNRKIHPSIRIKNVNIEANVQGEINPSTTIEHTKNKLEFRVGKKSTQRSPIKIFKQQQTTVKGHKRVLPSGKTIRVRKHKRRTSQKIF